MAYGAVLNQRNYWTPIIQVTGDYSTPDYTFTLTKDGTTTTTTGTANETLLYPWEFGEYTVSISDSSQQVNTFTVNIDSVKLYSFTPSSSGFTGTATSMSLFPKDNGSNNYINFPFVTSNSNLKFAYSKDNFYLLYSSYVSSNNNIINVYKLIDNNFVLMEDMTLTNVPTGSFSCCLQNENLHVFIRYTPYNHYMFDTLSNQWVQKSSPGYYYNVCVPYENGIFIQTADSEHTSYYWQEDTIQSLSMTNDMYTLQNNGYANYEQYLILSGYRSPVGYSEYNVYIINTESWTMRNISQLSSRYSSFGVSQINNENCFITEIYSSSGSISYTYYLYNIPNNVLTELYSTTSDLLPSYSQLPVLNNSIFSVSASSSGIEAANLLGSVSVYLPSNSVICQEDADGNISVTNVEQSGIYYINGITPLNLSVTDYSTDIGNCSIFLE